MHLKMRAPAFDSFWNLYKKIHIKFILHYKTRQIITKQFSSPATRDDCLSVLYL